MKKDNQEAKSLYDLYKHLDLPVDLIQTSEGFAILNLKDVGFEVPYQSPSFRPDYFSFLFIKDGIGKYSIDEHTFQVTHHSIYFTNPSNYRTFSWAKIDEIYLITEKIYKQRRISRFPVSANRNNSAQNCNRGFLPIGGNHLFANSAGIHQPILF